VDLCLVRRESDHLFRERILQFLPNGFPVGLDLFPYTATELARLGNESPEWYRCLSRGRVMTRS
jgi:hypothetical protein